MSNPLRFIDLLGQGHTEPSVSGVMEVQVTEPIPPSQPPQDLLILSAFRSGKPGVLNEFETLAALQNVHDPDYNGDEGVALARMSRKGFGDLDVFGAARIKTIRVDPAVNSTRNLLVGATALVQLETADYGAHTKRARVSVADGTHVGKLVTLHDDVRRFELDDLGSLMTVQYTGDASTATATVKFGTAVLTYSGTPSDGDGFTLTVGGTAYVFEFDTADPPVPGAGIGITIVAGDQDATYANAVEAILANVPNIESAVQSVSAKTVTVKAEEHGIAITEGTDTGNKMAVATTFPAARLQTTLAGDQTDGSVALDIPLKLSQYSTLDRLVSAINTLGGGAYTATISQYANPFLPSNGLDSQTALDITTAKTLTGYCAAIVDAINNRTRGNFIATELSRGTPDNVTEAAFTGGETSIPSFADYEFAFVTAGSEIERGAVVLLNSDDPTVINAAVAWIEEQRAAGKHFRVYAGLAPGLTVAQIIAQASQFDHTRLRVTAQRLGVIGEGSTITYLHPVYFAAVLAGGAAGNLPWVKTLTNKRLRVVGIHPEDSRSLTDREALIAAGVTIAKKEEDRTVTVLHVTTNRDPIRRMPRIASEIDTVDIIDGQMREAFLQFRGLWAGTDIGARVFLVGGRVLNGFVAGGALVPGISEEGEKVPAWRWLPMYNGSPFVIQAGVLKLSYQVWIGGELNHVSLRGVAEYQRIAAEVSGGRMVNLTTAVPVR